METQGKVSRLIIRATLKNLQERRIYKSLENLKRDLEEELIRDGFSIAEGEKETISQIVEEEGYTGRFAIDDTIWRKLRNKRYWPLVSIMLSVVIFLLTSVVGAIIQHFVEKPLEQRSAQNRGSGSAIAAFFQLPTRVYGAILDFRVTVQNQLRSEGFDDLVLFASAEESVMKIELEPIPPGGQRSYEGKLAIDRIKKNNFAFNAYIIGSGVSFKSEPVEIKKEIMVARGPGISDIGLKKKHKPGDDESPGAHLSQGGEAAYFDVSIKDSGPGEKLPGGNEGESPENLTASFSRVSQDEIVDEVMSITGRSDKLNAADAGLSIQAGIFNLRPNRSRQVTTQSLRVEL